MAATPEIKLGTKVTIGDLDEEDVLTVAGFKKKDNVWHLVFDNGTSISLSKLTDLVSKRETK